MTHNGKITKITHSAAFCAAQKIREKIPHHSSSKKCAKECRTKYGAKLVGADHSDIDANPEEKEESAESHEDGGHARDQQLLLQLTRELCRGHLIDKEPGGKK
eukprot:TRINITY_DN1938_c0_g1_i2.p1 TRINITY_DN1938_c0_g1~~TRINITY_DN1938_c0_g1_i2.p1  ORF type:complete len:103 (+),score=12.09 TRINITY_DN1938_c0_g1_i2:127-435(+)